MTQDVPQGATATRQNKSHMCYAMSPSVCAFDKRYDTVYISITCKVLRRIRKILQHYNTEEKKEQRRLMLRRDLKVVVIVGT